MPTFEGIAVTENCRFVDANPQMPRILGFEPGELIGRDIRETLPDWERSRVVGKMTKGIETPYEFELRRKDGASRVVEAHGQSIVQDGRKLRISAIRDIAERKEMERALQQSEELFRNLCSSAPVVIFRADSLGSIIYLNPHWEKISGFSVRESLGPGWLSVVHPEDRVSVGEFWLAEVKARRSAAARGNSGCSIPQVRPSWFAPRQVRSWTRTAAARGTSASSRTSRKSARPCRN